MINIYNRFDVLVVRFPFSNFNAAKARPVVVASTDFYNENSRNDLIVMALSSQINNKLPFEVEISNWKNACLLKPTILKSAIATVASEIVLNKLGQLSETDIKKLEDLLQKIVLPLKHSGNFFDAEGH